MKKFKRRRNRPQRSSRIRSKANRGRQSFNADFERLEDRCLLAALAEVGINDFRISDSGGTGDPTAAAFWTNVAYNSTDNEYLVIWQADDTDVPGIVDGESEIFGRILSGTDGSTIVPDFRISDAGTPGNSDITAAIPSVAYNSTDNEYLVVWYSDDNEAGLLNNEFDIFGQRLDADGNEIGPNDFRISDAGGTGGDASSAAFPSVAYNANDNEYLVVWKADDTDTAGIVVGEDEVFGQLLDANGNEIGTNDFRISDAGGSGNNSIDVFFTQVAHNSAANEYLVVWQADDTDAAGVLDREFEIFGQRLDAAGNEVGNNDFRISDAGGSGDIDIDAQDPQVVYNPTANEYLVVWYADDTDVSGILDDETEVFGQRLDAAGNEIGTNDFRISAAGGTGNTAIEVIQPRLAYSITDNEYLVIWATGHFDLDAGIVDVEFQIFGQQIDNEGNEIGEDDFQISDVESAGFVFGAGDPGVIHNPAANEFLAVWSANDTGTAGIVADETEVFGQRLGRPNVQIMDDGDTRFDPGGFTRLQSIRNPHGYVGDDEIMEEHYSQANSGNIATWTFTVTPGVYRVSANWVPHPNRATNSPFRVFDGPASGTPVAGRDINQQPAPDDFTDAGAAWEDIAQAVVITGTTLTVSLADFPTNGFVIADAVRIERNLQPEIELTDLTTGNPIADGGTVAMGSVLKEVPTSRNIRISNLGSGDLNVSDVSLNNTTGSAFSLMPDPDPVGGTGTIAFGGSADFTIALNTSVNGTFAATVTVTSNDADEGTFTFDVTATVDTTLIVDDGDTRFSAGGFTRLQSIRNPHGYVGDDGIMEEHYSQANSGNIATWTFTVTPGVYRVSANWVPHPNRATNSPFRVFDGPASGTPVAGRDINQQPAPDDFTDAGAAWEDIAQAVVITGTTLTVSLADFPTNGFVIADAVRIERNLQPEIELTDLTTGNPIADGGTVAMGGVLSDVPTSRNIRISNIGSGDLNVSDVSINNTTGAAFSLVPDPDPVGGTGTIAFGGSADFTIALDTSSNGTFAATVTITSNDADEGTFTFDVTATVDTTLIVDDGDLLRFDAGGFARLQSVRNPHGYVGDDGIMEEHYSQANSGNIATWTFTVTPGVYRVSANWVPHPNRATNSPFRVFDGPASGTPVAGRDINQQPAPDDFTDAGAAWEDIAQAVVITGTTLTVSLADFPTNGFVIADAVRIERDLQPEIELTDLTTNDPIVSGGTVAIGGVLSDVPTSRNIRISNLGSGDLNVSDVSLSNTTGSAFSLMPDPDPVGGTGTIAFGGNADFTIALDTSVNGTFAATVTVASNDADEGTFTFDVTATVDTTLIVDDGDLLRFDAGGFTRLQSIRNPHGFVGDDGIMEEHYSEQNDGNFATWSFTVTPGMYRVSANWVEHANRATNSPFSVFDGPATGTPAATATLNQRLAPDDFSDAGVFWEDIAVPVQINGTQLTVGLSDTPTNGFVIADAIRIERIPDPPPIAPSAPLAKAAAPLAANPAAELPEAVAVDLVAANSATASPAVAKTIRKGDSSAAPTRAARTDLVADNSALLSSRIFDDDDDMLAGIADEDDSRRDEEFVDQLFADLAEEAGIALE